MPSEASTEYHRAVVVVARLQASSGKKGKEIVAEKGNLEWHAVCTTQFAQTTAKATSSQ
jgi:hypothetical protein